MSHQLSPTSAPLLGSPSGDVPWVAAALAGVRDSQAVAYPDGTLAYLNPAMLETAGLTEAEARALDLWSLLARFRTGDFEEPSAAARRVLQTGQPFERELTFPARGRTIVLRLALAGVRAETDAGEGERPPPCLSVTVRDVTREKEYEKLRGELLSLMSHELRTPITSIGGFAELLLAGGASPAEAREFLSIIHAESQRLARMIDAFLSVARLEQKNGPEVSLSPVMLDDLVRETVAHFRGSARRKRIRLEGREGRRLPPVAADRALITRAVACLVDDAIRQSPERTTVTLSTALEAAAVRLTIEAHGLPHADQPKVWAETASAARAGAGREEESAGLDFVREVVARHGGDLSLDSEPGRGSRLSFTLPRL